MSYAPPLVRNASWRWFAGLVLAASFSVIVGTGAHAPVSAPSLPSIVPVPAPDALTPAVADLAADHPHRAVRVIVQVQPGGESAVRAAVGAAGGTVARSVELINALVVDVKASGAARIAQSPGVKAVSVDAPIVKTGVISGAVTDLASGLSTAYNQSIRSDWAWLRGHTGKGVGVAVIDTGIRGDLPDFRVSEVDRSSRVVTNATVNPGASDADDTFGHGTHVAGLIAGNGGNRDLSDPLRNRYAGAAPDANLIAIKADDGEGGATVLDVIDGLQFAVDHKATYNIRVVNLSLSSTVAESHKTDPLDAAVESAWLNGMVVVVAAGNRGGASDAVNYAPANDPWVITVGGVDDRGTKDIGDDQLASWSSRGQTQDGHVKPDILAPGARLASTIPPDSAYPRMCPSCMVDGQYFRVGGTSMAAAVASGAVATILSANPHWTPNQVKGAIIRRSRAVENQIVSDGLVVDAQGEPLPAGTVIGSEIVGGELAVDKVLTAYSSSTPPSANGGLGVNTFVDAATGAIDYNRTSWTRTSWTEAVDTMRTSWTRTSWTRTSWTRTSWTATEQSCADFERTSWTRTSWTADDIQWAKEQCAALLASVDPTRTSWTRTSWTRTSWTSSFDK